MFIIVRGRRQRSKRCPHDNEEDVLIPVQYSNVILPASGNYG